MEFEFGHIVRFYEDQKLQKNTLPMVRLCWSEQLDYLHSIDVSLTLVYIPDGPVEKNPQQSVMLK